MFGLPERRVRAQAPADSSIVIVNIGIDLSQFVKSLGEMIPRALDEHGHPEESWLRWDFRLLDGPKFSITDGGKIQAWVKYYGDIETKGFRGPLGCHLGSSPGGGFHPGKSFVFVDLTIRARPTIVQQGAGWFLRMIDVEAEPNLGERSDTKCGILGIEVSEMLKRVIKSGDIKRQVGKVIEGVNWPAPVPILWQRLSSPILLHEMAPTLCLSISPRMLTVGRLSGRINSAKLTIELRARLAVFAKSGEGCPAVPTAPPKVANDVVPEKSFHLTLPLTISHQEVAKLIAARISGTGRATEPTDLQVLSTTFRDERRLVVRLKVSDGREIEMLALPMPDVQGKAIKLTEITEAVQSLASAEGTRGATIEQIKTLLSSERIDIDDYTENVRRRLSATYELDGILLNLEITSLKLKTASVGADGLTLLFELDGGAVMSIPFHL